MDKSYRETLKPNQVDFWKNLWFYNKKIIIAVVVAIVIAVFGIVSCCKNTPPDAGIIIVTRVSRTPEATEKLRTFAVGEVEDINGDGKKTVDITEVFVPDTTSAELDVSNATYAVNEIINGDASVVIAEKGLIESFFEQNDFFEEPEESKYPLVYNKNGKAVAVDITSSDIAEMIEYSGKDKLYLLVKDIDENSELYGLYLQGLKIVEKII